MESGELTRAHSSSLVNWPNASTHNAPPRSRADCLDLRGSPLLHHRQPHPPPLLLNLLPTAPQLPDRIRRQNIHLLLPQLRLPPPHPILKRPTLRQQPVQDFL